ncbi:MAG: helix-turn-helix transcriptional regulator [Spirochaetaceae bacterium]|nr:helix-turn-helix transcriptional regulator [Spirochaetaceae bacterium]
MSFAENLKDLLDSKDIEIKELAHGTGISKNTIDNYLSGQKSIPNAENAVKIAKYLGTSVEYLITGNVMENNSNLEFSKLVRNLYSLKMTDFESIKHIINSLAEK